MVYLDSDRRAVCASVIGDHHMSGGEEGMRCVHLEKEVYDVYVHRVESKRDVIVWVSNDIYETDGNCSLICLLYPSPKAKLQS